MSDSMSMSDSMIQCPIYGFIHFVSNSALKCQTYTCTIQVRSSKPQSHTQHIINQQVHQSESGTNAQHKRKRHQNWQESQFTMIHTLLVCVCNITSWLVTIIASIVRTQYMYMWEIIFSEVILFCDMKICWFRFLTVKYMTNMSENILDKCSLF